MTLIQFRRGTAAQWTSANTELASGEFGYETDTGKFKIGPGNWNSLDYAVEPAVTDYLEGQEITFTDEGEGSGYFSVGGVPVSGTLVPPAATWSGIAGKPVGVVTPQEFDALSGTAGHDSTAGIQAAIDEAATLGGDGSSEVGGFVSLPPGVYEISDTIEIPARVSVIGFGRMVTYIKAAGLPVDTPMVHLGSSGGGFGSGIRNLTISGENVSGSVGIYSDRLEENAIIERVHVRRFQKYCIHIDANTYACQQFVINRVEALLSEDSDANSIAIWVEIRNNGRPSYMQDLSVGRVGPSGLLTGPGVGLQLDGVSGTQIRGVHAERLETDGILIGELSPCFGLNLVGLEANPASSLTRLVRISNAVATKSRAVSIQGIMAAGSLPLIVDDINGQTFSGTDLGYWRQGTPQSINGKAAPDVPYKSSTPALLSAGDNDDYAIADDVDTLRLQAAGAGSTVTGIDGGVPGRRLRVVSLNANALTFGHSDAGSAAENQIISPTGADIRLGQDDILDLFYDTGGTNKWRVVSPINDDTGTAALDFPPIAANSHEDLTITVTGAVTGDAVSLGVPTAAITAGVAYTAWVSAADTVTVRAHNYTAGTPNPSAGTFKASIIR